MGLDHPPVHEEVDLEVGMVIVALGECVEETNAVLLTAPDLPWIDPEEVAADAVAGLH
jgi:uncharacterized Fe-S cluster protein YjdI